MAVRESQGFQVPKAVAMFSYSLNFRVGQVLLGAWIGFFILASLVGFGAILLDLGNHLFGSASTNAFGTVNGALKDMANYRGHMLASLFAASAVLLTIERGALAQLAAAVGAIALHLVLLGAVL